MQGGVTTQHALLQVRLCGRWMGRTCQPCCPGWAEARHRSGTHLFHASWWSRNPPLSAWEGLHPIRPQTATRAPLCKGPVRVRGHSLWLKSVRLSKHLQELCALSLSLYRLLRSACWAYDLGISLLMSEIGNREPTSIETSPLRSPCIKLSGTWPRRSPKRSTRPANIGWFSGHCLHGAS